MNSQLKKEFRETWVKKISDCNDINGHVSLMGYRKFSPTNGHWGLSTRAHWDEEFRKNIAKSANSVYEYEVTQAAKGVQDLFVRIGNPEEKSVFMKEMCKAGVWNTVCLYRQKGENMEGFYFGTESLESVSILANSKYKILSFVNSLDLDFEELEKDGVIIDGYFDWG